MKGIQKIKVKAELTENLNEEEKVNLYENVDYKFAHSLISHTELDDFESHKTDESIIYFEVKLFFEMDLDDNAINELVSELDYEFNSELITGTEIVEIID